MAAAEFPCATLRFGDQPTRAFLLRAQGGTSLNLATLASANRAEKGEKTMRFGHLAMISCFAVSATACSAAVEPSGPGDPGANRKGETTNQTSEALNPACSQATLASQGVSFGGLSIPGKAYANFVGWCFSGGDWVQVSLVDDTTSQTLGSTFVQAGSDNGVFLPGAIQGSVQFVGGVGSGLRSTDHLQLIAIDPSPAGILVSGTSCFTLNGGC
jgi:hypothetical protein